MVWYTTGWTQLVPFIQILDYNTCQVSLNSDAKDLNLEFLFLFKPPFLSLQSHLPPIL